MLFWREYLEPLLLKVTDLKLYTAAEEMHYFVETQCKGKSLPLGITT
jgi:hypothetical protein